MALKPSVVAKHERALKWDLHQKKKIAKELLTNVPCGRFLFGTGKRGDPMVFCTRGTGDMCRRCDLMTRAAKALKEKR